MLEVLLSRFVWVWSPEYSFWLGWAYVSSDVRIVDTNDKLVPAFDCQRNGNENVRIKSRKLYLLRLTTQMPRLTDTLGFLHQSNSHFPVRTMPIVVLLALDFDCTDHISHWLVLLVHLSNHWPMRNSILSICSTLNCVVLEYHNYNHRPERTQKEIHSKNNIRMAWRQNNFGSINETTKSFDSTNNRLYNSSFSFGAIEFNRKVIKILRSNTTSANPLYCSHFLHVHLFRSS